MIDKSFFIDSCDDVELGIKRNSKLEYRISYDESKPIRAIFVLVGGFGSSVDTRMLDFTRRQFASRFGDECFLSRLLLSCFKRDCL